MGHSYKYNKRNARHNHGGKYKVILVLSLTSMATILLLFYLIHLQYQNSNNKVESHLSDNINYSQLISILGTSGYKTVYTNNITYLSGALKSSGFIALSISAFNATKINYNSSYPQFLSSLIILTNSTNIAKQLSLSAAYLYDNGPANRKINENNITYINQYGYNGMEVTIYTVQSISALNSTYIKYISNTTNPYPPLYQYVSTFNYGRIAVVVTTNGYRHLTNSSSIDVAEGAFRNIAGNTKI